VRCRFEHDDGEFGLDGVLYYLGTAGGTRPYENPHGGDSGVKATMSSEHPGEGASDPKRFAQHDHRGDVCNCTNNKPNDWMAVDLGETHLLAPDHYALQADSFSDGNRKLRHWVLEASVDGKKWEVLRKHDNDKSCDKAMGVATWALDADVVGGRSFRHFRIRQTGYNSGNTGTGCRGNNLLHCAGIELYGTLRRAGANRQ
jgi:hypothetical protein